MRNFFTKTVYVIVAIVVLIGVSIPAFAQFTTSILESNKLASAVAKDASGNIYVLHITSGSGTVGSGATGEIVKYTNGTGTASAALVTGIPDEDRVADWATGMAVLNNGDIYYITDNSGSVADGNIMKLHFNGSVWVNSVFVAGTDTRGFYTALATDGTNLYTVEYNFSGDGNRNGIGSYEVAEFVGLSTTPTVRYDKLGEPGLDNAQNGSSTTGYSVPTGLVIAANGDIYVADGFSEGAAINDGGKIIKLTAASSYAPSTISTGFSATALGFDGTNLFALQGTSVAVPATAYGLFEYPNATATQSPASKYTPLHHEELYPFGLVVINDQDIYLSDGDDAANSNFSDVLNLIGTPTTQASNVSFAGTTEKTTTINWTNGGGSSRAVFAALSSAGSISLTNGTTYTASTTFGSGTAAGAGWNCVYNGTGSTNSVGITNLTANTGYKVMVVEFNGAAGAQNYDTSPGTTNNPNTFTTLAAPVLTASGGSDSYSLGGTAATVDAGITVTAGQTNLSTATINVSTAFSSGDALNFTNQNGITGSFSGSTLTLSGSATVANYQTALQSITFSSSSASTSTRTISFLVGDGTSNSNTVTKNIAVTSSTTISSLTAVSGTTTNAASVQYTATFAASITGLSTADFTLNTSGVSGAAISGVSGSGTSWTVTVNTGSGSGTIQLAMNSSSGVTPSVSNATSGSPFAGSTYTIDKTAPTAVSINASSPSNATTTNVSSVTYTVTFSKSVAGVDATDFALTTSGTSGTVSGVSGSGTTYSVTVSSITGTGTLRLDLNSSGTGITDAAGNTISGGFTSGSVYNIDRTAPTVSSIALVENSSTNATAVDYTVTFSEPVTGVTSGAFGLVTTSGNATGAINSVTSVSTSVYTVNVTGVSGNGGLRLDLTNVSGISDLNGNPLPSGFIGSVYTIDNTPATLTSGSYFSNNGFSSQYAKVGDNLTLSVGYSEQLQSATMTIGGNSVPVSFSNNNQNFTGVYTMTSSDVEGNVGWTLSATDLAGNVRNYTNNDFGTVLIFDKTPPAIAISAPSQATANAAATVNYTVSYSDANFNFSSLGTGDITLNTTGTANATVGLSGSGTSYTVTISNITGEGTIGFSIGAGTAQDIPGNVALASSASGTFMIDNIAPTVSSITATTPSNANPINATSVSYTVTFSEAVTGVDLTSFTATTTNTVASTGIVVTPVSSSVYTVTVSGISGNGTVRLDLNSSGTGIADLAGNAISGGFTGGDTYAVDQTPPTATISAPSVAGIGNSGTGSVSYTVTYADANFSTSTLTTSGITLNITGTANGTVGVSGSGTSYTVTISGITGLGTIGISLGAGFASDLAGNTDAGAPASATFNVASADATLSSLAISQGTLTPIFATGQMSYTAGVSNAVASVTVTPASTDPGATIQVNGVTVASTATSGPIALAEGAGTTINTIVTAADGTTTATYSIVITRAPSGNARLSTIALTPHASLVNTGTTGTTTSYSATVANGITSVTVTPTAQDPTAVITVNSATVASGAPSGPIALGAEGSSTTINTVVTSQNGAATRTYSIVVTRAPSNDPRLSTIVLSPNTGLVNTSTVGSTTTYTASVIYTTASVTVTPTAIDPNAVIKVNGTTVASGTASGSLALGAEGSTTTITIISKAQDGVTTRTYSIAVTRAPSSDPRLATIATNPHAGLTNTGTVGNITTYTTAVLNSMTSITVTPTAIDPNAAITVNGTTVASGTASASIPLASGQTTITIISTSQDGTATRTYSITVTRPSTNNAELSTIALTPASLLVNTGTVGNTTSYTTSVDNATTSVTVTPTALDPNATIKVGGVIVPSGTASQSIALAVGQTTITTVVTAVDGIVTRTYSITVSRASGSLLSLHQPAISVTKPTDTVAIESDGIMVHQGVSPNGDGLNDFLTIDGINQYPDNQLTIIDRNGSLLYQAKGYDNGSKAFDGHSNMNGKLLQSGTYFYSLDYSVNGQSRHKTGYIILRY